SCRREFPASSASFSRSLFSSVICLSQVLDGVVGSIESHQARLVLDHRLQVYRPAPDGLHVPQRIRGPVQLQVEAVVFMPEQQFTAVLVVAVHHVDERAAGVGQAEQEPLLDLLELARLDNVIASLFIIPVAEHLMLLTKLGREETIYESNIVMNLAHFEDFLATQAEFFVPAAFLVKVFAFFPFLAELAGVPAALDVAEELDAELVRIDAAAA